MATFRSANALPEMSRRTIQVVGEFLVQTALFGVALDCPPKRHAALVFLLAASLAAGGAVLVRVIVVPRHILSPIRVREYRVASSGDDQASEALQLGECFNAGQALTQSSDDLIDLGDNRRLRKLRFTLFR
ncbi:hypothetical protein LT42_20650 [Pseudomonas lutea]|uniref:Uncharacterized protein n=1 Tax=Pseudomonas lutea TaxID=243924 RepID=A0A9X0EEG9_9PSED|nr:hypothetical protein LT42_20650 [Pseudomonas lutea]